MEVLHCNMATDGLPAMYTLNPQACALRPQIYVSGRPLLGSLSQIYKLKSYRCIISVLLITVRMPSVLLLYPGFAGFPNFGKITSCTCEGFEVLSQEQESAANKSRPNNI